MHDIYFTTRKTFEVIRGALECEEISVKRTIWLRKLYAFASRYQALSAKQVSIACDICNQYGFDLAATFNTEVLGFDEGEADETEMV